jgi:hypothetical protein
MLSMDIISMDILILSPHRSCKWQLHNDIVSLRPPAITPVGIDAIGDVQRVHLIVYSITRTYMPIQVTTIVTTIVLAIVLAIVQVVLIIAIVQAQI